MTSSTMISPSCSPARVSPFLRLADGLLQLASFLLLGLFSFTARSRFIFAIVVRFFELDAIKPSFLRLLICQSAPPAAGGAAALSPWSPTGFRAR